MNNKKTRKNKKERKKQEYRTKEERQSEVKEILKQLNVRRLIINSNIWLSVRPTFNSLIRCTNSAYSMLPSSFKSKYLKASSIGPSDAKLSEKVYGRLFFYNKAICISPLRGLSTHMTEGVMTPLVDWESICKEYIDDMRKKGIWWWLIII